PETLTPTETASKSVISEAVISGAVISEAVISEAVISEAVISEGRVSPVVSADSAPSTVAPTPQDVLFQVTEPQPSIVRHLRRVNDRLRRDNEQLRQRIAKLEAKLDPHSSRAR
ncbi:MAG: hypothetical protein AAFV53_16740, partial [Myxococcota bacterium]